MTPTTHALTLIGLSLLILGGVWAMDRRRERRIREEQVRLREELHASQFRCWLSEEQRMEWAIEHEVQKEKRNE